MILVTPVAGILFVSDEGSVKVVPETGHDSRPNSTYARILAWALCYAKSNTLWVGSSIMCITSTLCGRPSINHPATLR